MKKNRRSVKVKQIKEIMDKDTKSELNDSPRYYQYVATLIYTFYKVIKIGLGIVGIYFIWILLHYIASHLYVKWCVPNTMYGFLMSPFLVATPYCTGLRWLIYTGANTIHNMWILFGSWISSRMAIFMNP